MAQPVARPEGDPVAGMIDRCLDCGKRLIRLNTGFGLWRHDNGTVTCDPNDVISWERIVHGPKVEDVPTGRLL